VWAKSGSQYRCEAIGPISDLKIEISENGFISVPRSAYASIALPNIIQTVFDVHKQNIKNEQEGNLNFSGAEAYYGKRLRLWIGFMTVVETVPDTRGATASQRILAPVGTAGWMAVSVASFHAAYLFPAAAWLMVLFLVGLQHLTRARSARWAFYPALLVGIGCYGPHLAFFWGIFGPVAISLWTILAIWVGFFVLIAWSLGRFAREWILLFAVPIVWTGLEYFRCELYYLKFAWLTPGIAMSAGGWGADSAVGGLGVYGAGFIAALIAIVIESGFYKRIQKFSIISVIIFLMLAALAIAVMLPSIGRTRVAVPKKVLFVGIQLEGPSNSEVLRSLDAAFAQYPEAALLMLSEYTLDTPPTERIKAWCKEHQKYLVIGGKENLGGAPSGKALWADTAFVIDPSGDVVFSQGKAVPIQFFDDGVAAKDQRAWDSPWGKIGICICYDLSYTRVTDELVRQGAQILLVPTMDAEKWGAYEHALHARIAPVRGTEYGIQILRVGSSGISQYVVGGRTVASAPFPGQGEMIAAQVRYQRVAVPHSLPLDRALAPFCVAATSFIAAGLLLRRILRRYRDPIPPVPL